MTWYGIKRNDLLKKQLHCLELILTDGYISRIFGEFVPKDGKEHWTKVAENMIKTNVDVTVIEEQERFGFGRIIRKSN